MNVCPTIRRAFTAAPDFADKMGKRCLQNRPMMHKIEERDDRDVTE
jgi:hypothetical protein